jgi:hypothetical protein
MKKNIFKNGIIGGIIVSIVMIAMTYFMKTHPNEQPNPIVGFISMLLAFITVIVGIKRERLDNNGSVTFGKAFLTGLGISLVIATIYVLVWLIIFYNFFPNFMEQYSEMVLKNTKPEALASKTAEMNQMKEWYKNPIMVILLTYAEILPIGIIVSLISALILKKK